LSFPTQERVIAAVNGANRTVACGQGAVQLLELQPAGWQPMPAGEFLRGTPIPRGGVLH
jgi:methionyl-tRNA formyltransferase